MEQVTYDLHVPRVRDHPHPHLLEDTPLPNLCLPPANTSFSCLLLLHRPSLSPLLAPLSEDLEVLANPQVNPGTPLLLPYLAFLACLILMMSQFVTLFYIPPYRCNGNCNFKMSTTELLFGGISAPSLPFL